MRFWLSIIMLTCGAASAPAQELGFPDSLQVAAFPHLNVRNADRSAIVGTLPDGTTIASERLSRTGVRETIQGLAGEWLALDDSLRVFDAYLWIADPPWLERIEYDESQVAWEGEPLLDYGRRVVGSPEIPVFRTINEDYGGPGGDTYELEVIATKGAALNLFRRMLICVYDPERMPSPYEDQRERFKQTLRETWADDGEPLWFSWGSEGGGFSLSIRRNDAVHGGYILSYSMGTC
jgi:hypothetical protein